MAEKNIKGRIVLKHDTAENWSKATSFVPKQGEVIIYDKDANHSYERMKIGDGATLVSALPFIDDQVKATVEALTSTVGEVDDKVDAVSVLVGDTSVSEQINMAQIVCVSPDEPTDPNIKVWIKTSEEGTGIVPVLPRVATVTLRASAWTGSAEPYSQQVEIATVTTASKIDLQPTARQIVDLQNAEISLMIENNGGVVTCYAIGNKPTVDYTIQVLLQEVSYV